MPMPDLPPSPWHIVFYKDSRGRSPIADYLNTLPKQSQKTPPQELALAERRLAEVLTGGIEDG